MKTIYERAEQVLAWIGPAADDSETAMELMDFITDADTPNDYISQYLSSEAPEKIRGGRALAKLLDRPYWRRVWIRQELAVANEIMVMCGDRRLRWDTFENACDMLPTEPIDPFAAELSSYSSGYTEISDMESLREQTQADGYVSFEAMLLHAKSCEATDPRDRVYGTLDLAPEEVVTRMKPDYTLDTVEVYREATITAIATTRSLSLLSACEHPEQESGLPTWVPNLDDDWKADLIKRRMEALQECSSHSKASSLIRSVGGVWDGDLDTINKVTQRRQELAMMALVPSLEPSKAFEAFWRTVTADQEFEVGRMNLVSTFAASVASLIREAGNDLMPRLDFDIVEFTNGAFSPYVDMVTKTMSNRQVFTTSGGRIGIGNVDLSESDAVCVLFGTSMPFALRKGQSGGTYAIVNEIYLHGDMDSEITRGSPDDTKEFVLR